MFRALTMTAVCALSSTTAMAVEQFEWETAKDYSFIVPRGFDDNDEVTIAIDGFLTSTCHKLGEATWTLNEANRTIYIEQKVKKYSGECTDVKVPFTNYVTIPQLPNGAFTVTGPNALTHQVFMVSEAQNAGPDDFLYAPVEIVSIMNNTRGGDYAILEGRFTNLCMVWEKIEVIDASESVVILPIVKMEDRPDCVEGEFWFQKTVNLPKKAPMKRFLTHVRSLNGRAVNAMYTVKLPIIP
jgi:hypothetical protein